MNTTDKVTPTQGQHKRMVLFCTKIAVKNTTEQSPCILIRCSQTIQPIGGYNIVKKIICVIIVIIILIIISQVYSVNRYRKLELQLYGEYIVDETGLRNKLNVQDEIPFTGFIQLKGFDGFDALSKEFDMDFSIMKYNNTNQNQYLAISFGRKIEEITYKYLGYPYKRNTIAKANIVLSEQYNEHVMYVYLMDRILLIDSFIEGNSYYIMNGSNKIYMGNVIDDLNKQTQGDGCSLVY